MAIAWSGACQSNGHPGTYYEYTASYSNRRNNKVHVTLKLRLHMTYKSAYCSFAVGHECKVNGVYQSTNIKMDRTFWGGWDTYGYTPYGSSYDEMRDGTDWHGWYTVFDGDVPVNPADTSVTIIPCITRPCVCRGGASPYELNDFEKCNWQGQKGVWHPWGDTEYVGYWADSGCTEDGVFLNNRYKEELSGGLKIPVYAQIKPASNVKWVPSRMDVAQTSAMATVSWTLPQGAVGTKLRVRWWQEELGNLVYSSVIDVPGKGTSYSFIPHRLFGRRSGVVGDGYRAEVTPYDSNGVAASSTAESNRAEYIEHIKPNSVNAVNVDNVRIDVKYQDTKTVKATWAKPQPAGNTPVDTPVSGYHVSVLHNGKEYRAGDVQTENVELNPKRVCGLSEVEDGDRFRISITAFDSYGVEAENAAVSAFIEYYEVASVAPNSIYAIGRRGTNNEIMFKGETCVAYYTGDVDGSYPIERYVFKRLSDGESFEWSAGEALVSSGTGWKHVPVEIVESARPNIYETWELQAYNTKGRPVYSDVEHSTWTQVTLYRYGGLLYVYDSDMRGRKWREGICYVYDGSAWHEAETIYVYDDGWVTS